MNNEEFDRKAEFIVNQQAQFAVDIERLKESQARTEKNVAQNTETAAQTLEAVAQTAETVTRLASVTYEGFKQTFASSKEVDAKIEALVNSQIRAGDIQITSDARIKALEDSQAEWDAKIKASQVEWDAKIKALADSQLLTDEKLQKLIATVDRHISGRRNGGNNNPFS